MAVSQIGRGVFIVSPQLQKEYSNSAAGNYTSQFTKNRGDQWEMAKQQAMLEMGAASSTYAAQLNSYERRLAALDQRVLQIDRDTASLIRGEGKAQDAAYKTAEVEGSKRWKEENKRDEKQAEVSGARGASSSTTSTTRPTTTSTTVKTGGGAATVNKTDISAVDLSVGSSAPVNEQYKNIVTQQGAGGFGGGKSQPEIDAGVQMLFDSRIQKEADKYQTGGMDAATALDTARTDSLIAIENSPTTANMLKARWEGTAPAEGAGVSTRTTPGGTTTSTRYDSGSAGTPRYPGLGDTGEVPQIDVQIASRQEELDRLAALRAELANERAGLAGPTAPGGQSSDFITRARDIAAGRFGPTRGRAAPYVQRNTLDTLMNLPQEQRDAILEQYRKTLDKPEYVPTPYEPYVEETPYKTDYRRLPAGTVAALEGAKLNRGGPSGPMGTGEIYPDPERRDPEFGLTNPDQLFHEYNQYIKPSLAGRPFSGIGDRPIYPGDPTYGDTTPDASQREGLIPRSFGRNVTRGEGPSPDTSGTRAAIEAVERENAVKAAAAGLQKVQDNNRNREAADLEAGRLLQNLNTLYPEGVPPDLSGLRGTTDTRTPFRPTPPPETTVRGASDTMVTPYRAGYEDTGLVKEEGVIEDYPPEVRAAQEVLAPPSGGRNVTMPPRRDNATFNARQTIVDYKKAESDAAKDRFEMLNTLFPEGVPPEYAVRLQNAPSAIKPLAPQQFVPPPGQIDTVADLPRLDKRGFAIGPEEPKAEGVISDVSETFAPMSGGLPLSPGPNVKNAPQKYSDATTEANALVKATETGAMVDKFGGKVLGVEQKKPTTVTFLQERYVSATELAKKPEKVKRLTASGIGKVVSDIYNANKTAKKSLNRSWEEIVITYSGSKEELKTALDILLALDMLEDSKSRPKE